jgi:2-oxoglutarate ferredoxin oxidoreductase subunit beta
MKTKSTPGGVVESQFNPTATAIIGGASWVGRAFAGDIIHLKAMIKEAVSHRGFALLDVLQPCVTFNKLNTYDFFTKRCYKLDAAGHDPSDKFKALEKAMEDYNSNYEKIPVGVFYKVEKATYEDTIPWIKEKALVEHSLENIDISPAYHDLE